MHRHLHKTETIIVTAGRLYIHMKCHQFPLVLRCGDCHTIKAGFWHRMYSRGSKEVTYYEASTPGCLDDSVRHPQQEESWVMDSTGNVSSSSIDVTI